MNHQHTSLKKMGYRIFHRNPVVYAKPVGFHILTYNVEKREIMNFFGERSIWNTEILDESACANEAEFLSAIKNFESSTSLDKKIKNSLEFLTTEEMIEGLV